MLRHARGETDIIQLTNEIARVCDGHCDLDTPVRCHLGDCGMAPCEPETLVAQKFCQGDGRLERCAGLNPDFDWESGWAAADDLCRVRSFELLPE